MLDERIALKPNQPVTTFRRGSARLRWAAIAAVLLLTHGIAPAQQPVPFDPDWVKPFPPFHIIGNIYWVGTWDLSTYLITTPARAHLD